MHKKNTNFSWGSHAGAKLLTYANAMERRNQERRPTSLPVQVTTESGTWEGTCINLSSEGALLALQTLWSGESQLELRLDVGEPLRAEVIRASSPDHVGSFLAIRFLTPA